jgi:hypothetical protein
MGSVLLFAEKPLLLMSCNLEKRLNDLLKHLSKKLWEKGRNGALEKVLTLTARYSTSNFKILH